MQDRKIEKLESEQLRSTQLVKGLGTLEEELNDSLQRYTEKGQEAAGNITRDIAV